MRDEVVDYVRYWSKRTGLTSRDLVKRTGISRSKYYEWCQRYGKLNEHNAWVPRDHWLEEWEKQAILKFNEEHGGEGYRRMTYMMMDADLLAVSPSSAYRVLREADRLGRWNRKTSTKGSGFTQPLRAHEHWHTDISYINICGTFYYHCSLLDGYSRSIVHWEIRESMTEQDVEIIIQRACEKYPGETPRLISDNGPQFIARDFKEFIRQTGMKHVRTSPYYPQSNGKIERYHQSLKAKCIRPGTPLSLEEARRLVEGFVKYYNTERLHSALGYITPKAMLEGRQQEIIDERERKLQAARERRRKRRQTICQELSGLSQETVDKPTAFVESFN